MRISDWSSDVCSSDLMPYDNVPAWKEFRKLPLAEQEKGLRDPATRKRLVDATRNHKRETDTSLNNVLLPDIDWNWYFPMYRTLRSEERRVGQECVRTGRSRWLHEHEKKKNK